MSRKYCLPEADTVAKILQLERSKNGARYFKNQEKLKFLTVTSDRNRDLIFGIRGRIRNPIGQFGFSSSQGGTG